MFTWMNTTLWSFACICFSMIQFMRTTVIYMNFHGGNDCCVVLKSGTKFYAFAVLRNTFHYPPWLLLRCHQAAGELSDTLRK